jgi:RNA polymerase primary sigma factor
VFKTSRRLDQETGCHTSLADIAEELEIPLQKVDRAFAVGRWPRSLDAPVNQDDDTGSLLDTIGGEESTPEEAFLDRRFSEVLEEIVDTLEDREAKVVRWYYGLNERKPMTLAEIAERYGITRERVRQIKQKALCRLRHPSRACRLREFLDN